MRQRTLVALVLVILELFWNTGPVGADPGGPTAPSSPLGSSFTYQGRLQNNGGSVAGACDMAFRLYDAATAGSPVGNPITTSVMVTAGLFTAPLDFGASPFTGQARWLDIHVRCGAEAAFTSLSPRQPLTAAPYALYALSTGALQGQPVSSSAPAAGQVLKWNGTAWTPGTDNTGGGGAAWLITGNAGNSAANFLGTTDNMTLTLAVNGAAALQLVPTGNSPDLIGGAGSNRVGVGVIGATIGGGGSFLPNGGNQVSANYGTVSGGNANTAGGALATVAGGRLNSAGGGSAVVSGGFGNTASGDLASVGGGEQNTAGGIGATVGGGGWDGTNLESNLALANASTIGGGLGNVVSATAGYGTVGGGLSNTNNGLVATVGGGQQNFALSTYATVGGGYFNVVTGSTATVAGGGGNSAAGQNASVGGGQANSASGGWATVAGGDYNVAGGGNWSSVGGGYFNTASGGYDTVAGGGLNVVTSVEATVSGGYSNTVSGDAATVGGGADNRASGSSSTVGGGLLNKASGTYVTVSGGFSNTASGTGATVSGGGSDGVTSTGNVAAGAASSLGGGLGNVISSTAPYATLAGGEQNTISGPWSVVAGGGANLATGAFSAIGGGQRNTASGPGAVVGGGGWNGSTGSSNVAAGVAGTVAGGYGNVVSATAAYATVGGGANNIVGDWYATVPGGADNLALGAGSFAAGDQARALHEGAFVWADRSPSPVSSTAANQFLVRATGGISLTTNNAATTGCSLPAGGGSWSCTSDRNAKANFDAVDGVQVLNLLARLPIETWNFKTQDAAIRHMGPMAQDFHAAFGVGENDTTISTVDAQGVALAAIQGLYSVVQHKDAQIAAQDARLSAQDTRMAALEARVASIEAAQPPAKSAPTLPWLLFGALLLLNLGGLLGFFVARATRDAPRASNLGGIQ